MLVCECACSTNPMTPDGPYELDLSERDHRVLAAVLVRLALVEPGENVIDEELEVLGLASSCKH